MTAGTPAQRRLVDPRLPGTGRLERARHPLRRERSEPAVAVRGRVETKGPQRERHEPDFSILVIALSLTVIGLLMIYSSSGVQAAIATGGDPFAAVAPQIGWSALGLLVLLVAMRIDYRYLRLVSVPAYLVALALLVIVLLPPIGPFQPITVGGSARWLEIGPLPAMHPAEMAKLALVIYLAHWLAKTGGRISSLVHGMLPFLLIAGPCLALVALEPDLGTTGVLTLTAFAMAFLAGASLWQLLALVPVGVVTVALYILREPYQLARVQTFLDPWATRLDEGYQTVQGVMALALGGLLGRGLGESSLPGGLDVPNAQNDFIFAVIGQEFGFIGSVVTIGLFLALAYRGIRVALTAPDTFGALLAAGITSWLTFQALINIGVVVVLLPLTGITLPFVSDGGSSLVVSFAAVGILLSISRETRARGTWNDADPDRGRGYGRPHPSRAGRPAVAGRAGG